jgi:hypothetical protein
LPTGTCACAGTPANSVNAHHPTNQLYRAMP